MVDLFMFVAGDLYGSVIGVWKSQEREGLEILGIVLAVAKRAGL